MSVVFMFPGQSSRYPGMLEKPLAVYPRGRELLEEVGDLLGRDLRAALSADAPEPFARNEDIQLGVFVVNHLWMCALHAAGVAAELSIGLSLGEYNHLVHIEALRFEEALRLVQARGRAYDAGPSGLMTSIQPASLEEVSQALEHVRGLGVVEVVNLNSPTQQVLAGDPAAVEAAAFWLEEQLFVRAIVIERRLPMHSSLFRPVAELFQPALRQTPFSRPARPYIPNLLGTELPEPEPAHFVRTLSEHVCSPVRWRDCVDHVRTRAPEATLVEVGARSILCNLIRPKWFRATKACVDGADAAPEAFASLARGLAAGVAPTTSEAPRV